MLIERNKKGLVNTVVVALVRQSLLTRQIKKVSQVRKMLLMFIS